MEMRDKSRRCVPRAEVGPIVRTATGQRGLGHSEAGHASARNRQVLPHRGSLALVHDDLGGDQRAAASPLGRRSSSSRGMVTVQCRATGNDREVCPDPAFWAPYGVDGVLSGGGEVAS
jgi:hypothetical protein